MLGFGLRAALLVLLSGLVSGCGAGAATVSVRGTDLHLRSLRVTSGRESLLVDVRHADATARVTGATVTPDNFWDVRVAGSVHFTARSPTHALPLFVRPAQRTSDGLLRITGPDEASVVRLHVRDAWRVVLSLDAGQVIVTNARFDPEQVQLWSPPSYEREYLLDRIDELDRRGANSWDPQTSRRMLRWLNRGRRLRSSSQLRQLGSISTVALAPGLYGISVEPDRPSGMQMRPRAGLSVEVLDRVGRWSRVAYRMGEGGGLYGWIRARRWRAPVTPPPFMRGAGQLRARRSESADPRDFVGLARIRPGASLLTAPAGTRWGTYETALAALVRAREGERWVELIGIPHLTMRRGRAWVRREDTSLDRFDRFGLTFRCGGARARGEPDDPQEGPRIAAIANRRWERLGLQERDVLVGIEYRGELSHFVDGDRCTVGFDDGMRELFERVVSGQQWPAQEDTSVFTLVVRRAGRLERIPIPSGRSLFPPDDDPRSSPCLGICELIVAGLGVTSPAREHAE